MREDLITTVSQKNVQELLPELDAKRFIDLRDNFLRGEEVSSRMFFTTYTYIKWYQKYC